MYFIFYHDLIRPQRTTIKINTRPGIDCIRCPNHSISFMRTDFNYLYYLNINKVLNMQKKTREKLCKSRVNVLAVIDYLRLVLKLVGLYLGAIVSTEISLVWLAVKWVLDELINHFCSRPVSTVVGKSPVIVFKLDKDAPWERFHKYF